MADDQWTMQDDPGMPDDLHGNGAPPLPNVFTRAVMVIVSPGKLFAALAERPAVIGVMLLSAAVAAVAAATAPPDPQVVEAMGELASSRGIGMIGAVVVAMLAPLFYTLITMLLFRAIRRDDVTFKQHLAVNAHALFIPVIGSLALVPLLLATSAPLQTFSIGGLLAFLPEGFLTKWLSQFGLFSCWTVAVAALGLSALDERRTWRGTLIVLVALWAAWNAVGVVLQDFALSFAENFAPQS